MSAIWVEITATRGSAPRDAGTAMKVTATRTTGTIGGGALELRAIQTARALLAQGERVHVETVPLGPGLGQCCGGVVSLRYSDQPKATDVETIIALTTQKHAAPAQLWLWGAGHVGRAIVRACPAAMAQITWVDDAAARFPSDVPDHVVLTPAADMPLLAAHADRTAHHLIFTYSHDIDLALCAALTKRGARHVGLIGSQTKWRRFSKRLRDMGLDPMAITCPIGDKSLGKAPAAIAQGVLQALSARPQTKASA